MRFVLFSILAMPVFAAAPTGAIKVDQVGYLPGMPKLAFVAASDTAAEFTVRLSAGDEIVFRGKLSAPAADADSGDHLQTADFTKLTRAGTYYIDVSGLGHSWNFAIGPAVYARAWYLAMRSYYGQRCGTAVDLGSEFPGYKHAACHLEGAYHPSSGKTGPHVSKGGWHDAGDYGRYVVNSGISTGTLLWTWEVFGPRLAKINLHLPESGNGTPDLLNEIRWNLEWMLTMQDDDGGVWHKQTSEQFCPFILPEADKLVSYVIGTGQEPYKNSCATGDFAAVMAIAARAYKPYDASFAARALRAAESAWKWLGRYPDVTFANPAGVGTGAYGDRNCGDERLWAAAELFRTTGKSDYQSYFLAHYADFRKSLRPDDPQSWSDVGNLGLWTYVLGGVRGDAAAAIRQDSIAAADQIVARSAANGYRISLTARNYIWGSNGVLANYGVQLLVANAFQPNPRYVETALEDLHYIFGRNTFSLSFVTQVGENPFRHPHHRLSAADDRPEPWPGLMSGGPNRGRQDEAMRKELPADLPPARMYLDEQPAYAANEVAINWNAPLVFLLAGALPAQ
jgi:endoglucanase